MAYLPRALLLNREWSSTEAVEAMRLWSELPEGLLGAHDVGAAGARALLTPGGLGDALGLLVRAGLVAEGPRGYTRRTP